MVLVKSVCAGLAAILIAVVGSAVVIHDLAGREGSKLNDDISNMEGKAERRKREDCRNNGLGSTRKRRSPIRIEYFALASGCPYRRHPDCRNIAISQVIGFGTIVCANGGRAAPRYGPEYFDVAAARSRGLQLANRVPRASAAVEPVSERNRPRTLAPAPLAFSTMERRISSPLAGAKSIPSARPRPIPAVRLIALRTVWSSGPRIACRVRSVRSST